MCAICTGFLVLSLPVSLPVLQGLFKGGKLFARHVSAATLTSYLAH